MPKKESQKKKLLEILSDYKGHRTDEIVEKMFGDMKYGLFRIGARIWDLKKDGYIIKGWKDKERPQLYWYKMEPKTTLF